MRPWVVELRFLKRRSVSSVLLLIFLTFSLPSGPSSLQEARAGEALGRLGGGAGTGPGAASLSSFIPKDLQFIVTFCEVMRCPVL
jgi:hypothetical protein